MRTVRGTIVERLTHRFTSAAGLNRCAGRRGLILWEGQLPVPARTNEPRLTAPRYESEEMADGTKSISGADSEARLDPIGVIRSTIKTRAEAPKQGAEGAPDAWLEVNESLADALDGIARGDEIIVLTWLHRARRDVLKVHPRSDPGRPLTGVFATRSPDRPNPIGIHSVTVREVQDNRLRIGPIEVIDGTPVVDIKPVEC
jgi:tRNA-Thr(GGU) m(6)t(6)A37 methyltransferase TsaA